jgi:hypothetical protein
MLEIPDEWHVTWNNLALEEKEFTRIESLFCATHHDLVIWVDYGERDGVGTYSFTLRNGVHSEPIEQAHNLTRTAALSKLEHWLQAALKLQTFTARRKPNAVRGLCRQDLRPDRTTRRDARALGRASHRRCTTPAFNLD